MSNNTQLFLVQLRNLSVDRVDMDEAVAAQAISGSIINEFAKLEIDPPEWLKAKHEEIQTQVKLHYRDFVIRSARQAELKAQGYKSREAKQADAEAEAKKWKDKLAKL